MYPDTWGESKPALSAGYTKDSLKSEIFRWNANLYCSHEESSFQGTMYAIASVQVAHKETNNARPRVPEKACLEHGEGENRVSFKVYCVYETADHSVNQIYMVQISPAKRKADRYREICLPGGLFRPGLGYQVASVIGDQISKSLLQSEEWASHMPPNHPCHAVLVHARQMLVRVNEELTYPAGAERARLDVNLTM
jgi:hypothetical protein